MTKAFMTMIAASLGLMLTASASCAADGGIRIDQAWARATPGGAKTGAIYLTLTNTGNAPDTLIAVNTDAADKAELHEMKMQNNIMEMRPIPAITIAPGQSVTLAPNGYHIMLVGLKAPLKEGETVPLTLTFEHAGKQQAVASVTKLGAVRAGETSTMPGMSTPGRQR